MEFSQLNEEEKRLLDGIFLFENADPLSVGRMIGDPLCTLETFRRGDVIYSARRYSRSVGCVLSGQVRVSKAAADSRRYIMKTLTPGECFGAAAVFCNCPEYVTVLDARCPCRIVFFPQTLLESLMAECPAVAMNYIRFLSDRIRFLNDRIQGLISPSACQALAAFLMDCCTGGKTAIVLAGSIASLADRLNIGRSSLYRAFGQLERRGLIAREGKRIRILDPDGLSRHI